MGGENSIGRYGEVVGELGGRGMVIRDVFAFGEDFRRRGFRRDNVVGVILGLDHGLDFGSPRGRIGAV